MEKIAIYCRLSNERDSAYYTENEENIELDELEQADEGERE